MKKHIVNKQTPYIGQKVILVTLLKKGYFPGKIIDIDIFGRCVVKLDCQEEPVRAVLYYDGPQEEIKSSLWQACWPE